MAMEHVKGNIDFFFFPSVLPTPQTRVSRVWGGDGEWRRGVGGGGGRGTLNRQGSTGLILDVYTFYRYGSFHRMASADPIDTSLYNINKGLILH